MGLGRHEGVINDIIFIFGWTNPLRLNELFHIKRNLYISCVMFSGLFALQTCNPPTCVHSEMEVARSDLLCFFSFSWPWIEFPTHPRLLNRGEGESWHRQRWLSTVFIAAEKRSAAAELSFSSGIKRALTGTSVTIALCGVCTHAYTSVCGY